MTFKYKLVDIKTNEILTYGDDNTIAYRGLWGDLQADGIAVWQDNTETKAEKYAAVNDKYMAEITNIREAIRLMLDAGKDATTLRAKLAAKQAEYKAALLGVM